MYSMFGQNTSGDFDQLSLHGVDFGDNFERKFNIQPHVPEGEAVMYGDENYESGEEVDVYESEDQMGHYNQMGVIPSGLGSHNQLGHYSQMGSHNQLGIMPSGLSGIMTSLQAPVFTVAGVTVTRMHIAMVAAAAAGYYAYKSGALRRLGIG